MQKNLYAYRKFYNTSHAIIPVIETVCETLNMGHYGGAVYKRFIYKLYKAGIKGMLLTILDSFLTNKFSRNLVDGYINEWLESEYSVQYDF